MITGLEMLPCRFRAPYTFHLRLDCILNRGGDPVEVPHRVWTERQHWEFLEWVAGLNEYGLYLGPMTVLDCQPLRTGFVVPVT